MPPTWYVTDPATGRVQSVEADAESTARWVAWTAWYGSSARIDDRDDAHFDDLEPRLTRQGYSVKVLAEQFHARPAEIRRFLNGQLDPGRTRELADRMRAVGLAL